MRIAVLHNPRPATVDEGRPDDWYEEFDSLDTVRAVCRALEELGAEAVPVVADRRLPWRLQDGGFGFAFNMAEGEGRRCRSAIPAAICDMMELPFTGSDAMTLAVAQDKAAARRIVSPEVRVAKAALVESVADEAGIAALAFPVFVKPNDEGSSKGIARGSLCASVAAAAARCAWLRSTYGCPVLVEEFLPGAEVTVGVRGNGDARRVLGMMEIGPTDRRNAFVYDLETKRNWREAVRYHIPPRLPDAACAALAEDALQVCRLLGCRDLARIDFRLDGFGRPHFLECNPLPGLDPDRGDIVLLSRGILSHGELVRGVLLDAARRHGVSMP